MATTRLDGPLRRELDIAGDAYTLTITPQRLTLIRKGRRKGLELEWTQLVSGDAALATALNASLKANLAPPAPPAPARSKAASR
jgi:hypothetical protein